MHSIQASRSQNKVFTCGPLRVCIDAADDELAQVAGAFFGLYGGGWPQGTRSVRITIARESLVQRASGSFLTCARMSIDRTGNSYLGDTQYGIVVRGRIGDDGDVWKVAVPPDTVFDEPQIGDMEDVFSLILTAGWRAQGYVALHAGAVVKRGVCAVLCTGSGGGKSTLTTSLVLNGWATLGDDKLLLRSEGGVPVLRSLLRTFNLDPSTCRWFDVGDLEALPRYSAWTIKRRVPLEALRADAGLELAHPTHVVRVGRAHGARGIGVRKLGAAEVAETLLRQVVLPSDPEIARWTMQQTLSCAPRLRGVQLDVGDDAYAEPGWLGRIEEALS